MRNKPPKSRNQLEWHRFEKEDSGNWILKLPSYYAAMFQEQESALMQKSNTGWRDSHSDQTMFACFMGLTDAEHNRIKQFIEDYKRFVIIGLNKNIEQNFRNELDFCMALDYNFESHDSRARTQTGELVYQVKYKGSKSAVQKIVQRMQSAIKRIPRCGHDQQSCLSYIPPSTDKFYDLPKGLAKWLAVKLEGSFSLRKNEPVVHPVLEGNKPSSKTLALSEKVKAWEKIISSNRIHLSSSVEGCTVYVIDDLYQSGATIWSYAKHLKSVGASCVLGLVCVKSLRDTDNK